MKTNEFKKKLTLKKVTIKNLSDEEKKAIKGGIETFFNQPHSCLSALMPNC